jgi:hypothetical protein
MEVSNHTEVQQFRRQRWAQPISEPQVCVANVSGETPTRNRNKDRGEACSHHFTSVVDSKCSNITT